MAMSHTKKPSSLPRLFAAALAAIAVSMVVALDASAQRANNRDNEEEEGAANRVFSPDIGEIVVAANEKLTVEPADYRGALADLDRAMNSRGISPYEHGVVLFMRGGVKYQLEDIQGALADWNRALNEGDLNSTERLSIMYNVGQLYLAEGNYREAVNRIEEWIRLGGVANDGVHLNLVAAYVELGELRSALGHARQAYEKASPRAKRHYDTLDYLYGELDMPAERAAILSEAVAILPQEKRYWLAIAQLHAAAGREQRSFEINKIMYLNGMLTTESEIMRVVDYYSYYEVPFRGARILEREMNAGRVERTQRNLEKLARLYRQANEFDRAIPALEAAARLSPDGELFQALGEAYYAEARLGEAVGALTQAIDKGGIDKTGDVWIVIGNARYEDGDREGAIEAFEQGERFASSRETAREWRQFVEGEVAAARNRAQFGVDVLKEEHRVSCERQLADIIIYQENRREGDPDCVAIVRQQDFTSVPQVIEMQLAVDAEFGDGETEGAPAEAEAPAETTDASETPDAEAPATDDAG
jgi:tetratricopeptide (TPR) repeat protein